jgi:hypothetical protein
LHYYGGVRTYFQEEHMVGRVLRLAGYARAPVKMFMVMHPVRALKWGATYLIVKKALELEKRPV